MVVAPARLRGHRRHSSTLPSAVVRVAMVLVEPLDEERGPVHPRAGEVRFHGDRRSSPSFMPPRATARHPNVLREGVPSPGPPSQGAHIGGAAQLPALEAPPSAFRPSMFGDKGAQKGAQNGTTGERATEPSAPPYAFTPAQFLKDRQPDAEAPNLSDDGRARPRAREYSHYCDRLLLGCFRLFICLCLATVCLFLVRIDDALRTGGANTNFWITGTSVRSPPPPQLPAASSPPPPPPVSSPTTPASSPTTPSTFVSSPAGLVEYSVLTWEPTYHDGYGPYLPGSLVWWNPIRGEYGRYAGGSADTYRITSDRSFIDVARSKGITNYDIFTTCSWPNVTQSVEAFANSNANSYTQTTNTFGPTTTGQTWNGATIGNRGCVVEKLVNKLSESGWTLLTSLTNAAFGYDDSSYVFTRQNATSSLLTTPSTSVSALTGPAEYKTVTYNPRHYEYTNIRACMGPLSSYTSCQPGTYGNLPAHTALNESFVDVVRREGVDNATIFETCDFPSRTIGTTVYTGSTGGYSPPYTTHYTYGKGTTWYFAGPAATDCVTAKFLSKLAESGWELHSFTMTLSEAATTPTNERHTFVFTRQNATSS